MEYTATDFVNADLADENNIRAVIAETNATWSKMRGSKALALLCATGYVTIRWILANVAPDVQAALLDEKAIQPAKDGTSDFSPWIGVLFGEETLDPDAKTFTDRKAVERKRWDRDRTMERYFQTMEELRDMGVHTDDVDYIAEKIMANGGAAAMAKARVKRLSGDDTARKKAADERRELFLEETKGVTIELPIEVPEERGDFGTLLIRFVKGSSSQVEVLGFADTNAGATVNKMAREQFEALSRNKKERASSARAGKKAATGSTAVKKPNPMLERAIASASAKVAAKKAAA